MKAIIWCIHNIIQSKFKICPTVTADMQVTLTFPMQTDALPHMYIDLNALNLDQTSVDDDKKDIETCNTRNSDSRDFVKTHVVMRENLPR